MSRAVGRIPSGPRNPVPPHRHALDAPILVQIPELSEDEAGQVPATFGLPDRLPGPPRRLYWASGLQTIRMVARAVWRLSAPTSGRWGRLLARAWLAATSLTGEYSRPSESSTAQHFRDLPKHWATFADIGRHRPEVFETAQKPNRPNLAELVQKCFYSGRNRLEQTRIFGIGPSCPKVAQPSVAWWRRWPPTAAMVGSALEGQGGPVAERESRVRPAGPHAATSQPRLLPLRHRLSQATDLCARARARPGGLPVGPTPGAITRFAAMDGGIPGL